MITIPTVFVLGAGASAPYGFPTSFKLTENICQRILAPTSDIRSDYIREINLFPDRFVEMASHLRVLKKVSIDEWLARNQQYKEYGKLCIAREIATSEGASGATEDEDWINDLWTNYLLPECLSITDIQKNMVQFITFNYDRSLEHMLYLLVQSSFPGATPEERAKAVQSFKIIHVHGQVGFLPWQENEREDLRRNFARDESWKTARKHADQIKIISELDAVTPEYVQARKCLHEAKRIYFLGFGYHDENMKRLKPKNEEESVQLHNWVVGSAFNLELRDRSPIESGYSPIKYKIRLGEPGDNALNFLRRSVPRYYEE